MSKFEDACIISGIGQSEVGRRVEKGVMALTLDAALEAIGDAGLKPADIDGVDLLARRRLARRRPRAVEPRVLRPRSPRRDRRAAPEPHLVLRRPRDARHVRRGDPCLHGRRHRHVRARARLSRVERGHGVAHGHRARQQRRRRRDRRDAVDASVRRLLGPELDGPLRHPPHARVRHDARAARGDRPERPPQRPAQPEGRAAGRPHDGRLSVLEDDQRPAVPVRLRHRRRRRDRPDRVEGRACRRHAEPADPLRGGRQRAAAAARRGISGRT